VTAQVARGPFGAKETRTGLPASSSQASIGGLVGGAIASASTVHWMTGVVGKVIVPMILSPSLDSPMGTC
jgi:PiT family inorganic phosphate transporter